MKDWLQKWHPLGTTIQLSNVIDGYLDAIARYYGFISGEQPDDGFYRSLILLARYEDYMRRRDIRVIHAIAERFVPTDAVSDLMQIHRNTDITSMVAQDPIVFAPTFGDCSAMVGGADTDLIVGDCIVDVKTVVNNKREREYINQLLGYYLLMRRCGITIGYGGREIRLERADRQPVVARNPWYGGDTRIYEELTDIIGEPLPHKDLLSALVPSDGFLIRREVTRIGLFYARHNFLVTWPVSHLLDEEEQAELSAVLLP